MNLQKAKIYHDGSHFIAIPQGAYPSGKGCKAIELGGQSATVMKRMRELESKLTDIEKRLTIEKSQKKIKLFFQSRKKLASLKFTLNSKKREDTKCCKPT